jgi:hypothetical protein
MNKSWFYLGLVGSLAIGITSCGDGGSKPAATPSASPSAAASPAASPVATAPAASPTPSVSPAATTPTTATATPTTPTKPVSVDVAAGLIPPTDGDNWTKTVSKGRNDPFALLSLRATEVAGINPLSPIANSQPGKTAKTGNTPVKSGSNKSLPGIKVRPEIAAIDPIPAKPNIAGKPSAKVRPGAGSVDISQIPRSGVDRPLPKIAVAVKPKPGLPSVTTTTRKPIIGMNPAARLPRRDPKIVIKPLPQPIRPNVTPGAGSAPTGVPTPMEPILAQSVGISGVIEVSGRTQVIVRLPNESFSRYVEVGDRIYDGKVIVKRVEGEQTLSPMVILEEAGREVSRKVGDLAGSPPVKAASTKEAPPPSLP